MVKPKIFVDFQNADAQGRLRLNCIGTIEDLACQGVALSEGLGLTVYSEDLEVDGQAHYSAEEKLWVAVMDWKALRAGGTVETPAADGSGDSAA
jgi:hypothetical protein